MTTWNYRTTVRKVRVLLPGVDDVLEEWGIREVYYDDAGKIISWSEEAIDAHGESLTELANDFSLMGRALALPVVDLRDEENPVERPITDFITGKRWAPNTIEVWGDDETPEAVTYSDAPGGSSTDRR